MTLNQALAMLRERLRDGPSKAHFLVCGSQPMHLETFLRAHLMERLPSERIEVLTGLYGDLAGNLNLAAESSAIAAAIALEWSDVDQRLGLRGSGGWSSGPQRDILASCRERYLYLAACIRKLAARMPVALAPPGLPLPPIGNTIRVQASTVELDLDHQLASFLLDVSQIPGVRVVNRSRVEQLAPGANALDAKMELLAGFPYTVPYASALAQSLAGALYQPPPKKGIITDLDDTLWSGLVGEVGPDAVSWQQEHHTQSYGLYQQMLGHLADCGVLIGVCSKNEASVVEQALARKDLFLDAESLFPVCAGWGAKSASVGKILQTWNIGPEAVVFIDDNQLELSEVQETFPDITCIRFPGTDPAKVWNLLGDLRDLFGKPQIMAEDRLRRASLRGNARMDELGQPATSPEFLRGLQGTVSVDYRKNSSDQRPLELINKTNQFNLNGRRMSAGEMQRTLERDETILAVVSYQDKFGPLGKIAVVAATRGEDCVRVFQWVMSCRAFSRRIEYHTLDSLFRQTNAEEIEFAFETTDKNSPMREFLQRMGFEQNGGKPPRLSRSRFSEGCEPLPHHLSELLT